jgi:glucans biosynthesis protein
MAVSGSHQSRAGQPPLLGLPEKFDFTLLCERARQLAAQPFRPSLVAQTSALEQIDYDAYQKIRFRPGRALWSDRAGSFPISFFHLGRYFKEPVSIHVVEAGEAREIIYSPDFFDIPANHVAWTLPRGIGFAGFRVMNPDSRGDWLAFLGAAYFRSAGPLKQYGPSARGVAIDTGLSSPEEFPRFTSFWLEASAEASALNIYALLDGPSLAGAYRMIASRQSSVIMEIRAEIFIRKPVQRLGIAPLTSMFWYGENNRSQAKDWRPEIHDSDGLAIWTGNGERIWRPLVDPPSVQTNSFMDKDVRGFGLLQRDRDPDHFQDDQVFYERRPSVWVEPVGPWGEGAVQLVEIPTDDEVHDNIVAYWVPKQPASSGAALSFDYRLRWVAEEPFPPAAGRVVATRLGRGGVPGQAHPPGRRKFAVDFAGGPLELQADAGNVVPVVTASRGEVHDAAALHVTGSNRWRAFFDLQATGPAPINLRMFLRGGDRALTETWLYQYFPEQP